MRLQKLAEKHECNPAQLALAWILHQGDDVAPIPGELIFLFLSTGAIMIDISPIRADKPCMCFNFFTGTTKIKNLDDNIGSLRVKLTNEDLDEISSVIPINEVAGDGVIGGLLRCSWKFANTPAKDSPPLPAMR